jgi:hypothetical protein
LPPILSVQMDNAIENNKNRIVFCFWSLLITEGIFKEVYMNSMLPSHTQNDIDKFFGRWSISLRKEKYLTIPLLMKSFTNVESTPIFLHLIQEVPAFKGFIARCIVEGDESLEGHIKAQQFRFFVVSNGCSMMKYKIHNSDSDWLPKDGSNIKLWQEDEEWRFL